MGTEKDGLIFSHIDSLENFVYVTKTDCGHIRFYIDSKLKVQFPEKKQSIMPDDLIIPWHKINKDL
jgi:hypothetical protein